MIRRLQIDFRKYSVLGCLVKQILHIWKEEGVLGRMTINFLRIVDHHPWLGSVPNDKGLSPPAGRRGNLDYAFSEHSVNFSLHEGDVLRFVTTRFCSNRFGTINCFGKYGRRGNFHRRELQFLEPGRYNRLWSITA